MPPAAAPLPASGRAIRPRLLLCDGPRIPGNLRRRRETGARGRGARAAAPRGRGHAPPPPPQGIDSSLLRRPPWRRSAPCQCRQASSSVLTGWPCSPAATGGRAAGDGRTRTVRGEEAAACREPLSGRVPEGSFYATRSKRAPALRRHETCGDISTRQRGKRRSKHGLERAVRGRRLRFRPAAAAPQERRKREVA